MGRYGVRASALVVALALLGGGCAGGAGPTVGAGGATPSSASASPPGPSASPPAPVVSSPPPATVPATLRFRVPKVGGGTFDGATLAGRPSVLWFWASWCTRCRAKAADVRDMHERYGGQVNVVGVAGLGSGAGGMRSFVSDRGLSGFPHLADDAGVLWKRFGVTEQEYFVLLDARGEVVHKGPLGSDQLGRRVGALAAAG